MSTSPHNSVEPTSEFGVSLLIRRGRTESRVRPVNSEKFLIGSSPTCDLQLGGNLVAALHSILHVDGNDVWIEAMSLEPLVVNHHEVDSCLLRNGDRVEIGAFEFQIQIDSPRHQVQTKRAPHFDRDALRTPETIQKLSAEKIVDALDHELRMVEQFQSRRSLGADALMRAIEARRHELQHQEANEFLSRHDEAATREVPQVMPQPFAPPAESFGDVDQVIERIQATLRQLEQRSAGLEHREEAFADAAATLMEVQERFAQQLEAIQQHLNEWPGLRMPRRASA